LLLGEKTPLSAKQKEEILGTIHTMAKNALRTVAIASREFSSPIGDDVDNEAIESDLTLHCIVGIKDPLRPDVIDAVRTCQEAGIFVRMVTGKLPSSTCF
jgi:magnesium-transporting ATPase (P-type)